MSAAISLSRRLLLLIALCGWTLAAVADDVSEQTQTQANELDTIVGGTIEISSAGFTYGRTLSLGPSAWVQVPISNRVAIQATFPLHVRVDFIGKQRPRTQQAIGDPVIGLAMIRNRPAWDSVISGQWSIPISLQSEDASSEGILAPGRGSHAIGIGYTFRRIADPLLLSLAMNYEAELPRQDQYRVVWRPLIMELAVRVTEVFNEVFAMTLELKQSVASHTIPIRVPMISDLRGQTTVSINGVYSVEESTFSAYYAAQEGIGTRASKVGLEYARRFPNME